MIEPAKAQSPAVQRDEHCVFCKIVAGQIPCHKIYEDDRVLSFLDIGPLSRGHTLVIPKAHYVTLDQVPGELVGACAAVLPRLGGAVCGAVGAGAWNVLQNNGRVAGQQVDHVHFHIIPRVEGDGLGYRWPAGKLDAGEGQRLLELIRGRL